MIFVLFFFYEIFKHETFGWLEIPTQQRPFQDSGRAIDKDLEDNFRM
jgi:hypothetical protein